MQFRAHIENGKLAIETPESYRRYLSGLNEGTKMTVAIDKKKNTRSLSQNAFLWLYYGVIENETGTTANDVHEWAKRMFLPPRFISVQGMEIRIPASTTNLSKHDFSEYLDKICAATSIPIPDPALAGYESNHQQYLTTKPVAYPSETSTGTAFD